MNRFRVPFFLFMINKFIKFDLLIDRLQIIFVHQRNQRGHIDPLVYPKINFPIVTYAPFKLRSYIFPMVNNLFSNYGIPTFSGILKKLLILTYLSLIMFAHTLSLFVRILHPNLVIEVLFTSSFFLNA